MQMFHRLLQWGWWYLYSRDDTDIQKFDVYNNLNAADIPVLTDLIDYEPNGQGSNMDDFFSQANQTREILKRCEKVRAKKAGEWINSSRMIPDLVHVIIGIGPNESYLHFLLKEHAECTWSGQYGLGELPLVRLSQAYKSPAVRVLDEYWRLQTSPPDVVLSVLTTYPSIDMWHETTVCFHMLLDMAASVWRRQVRKHAQFPWSLATLLDSTVPQQQRETLLSSFFSSSPCCLEPGTALPLKMKFESFGLQCLESGSKFQQVILCMNWKTILQEVPALDLMFVDVGTTHRLCLANMCCLN